MKTWKTSGRRRGEDNVKKMIRMEKKKKRKTKTKEKKQSVKYG